MILLQIVWIAAHVGLRKLSATTRDEWRHQVYLWDLVHDVTEELGFPPAPRMEGAS